MYTLVERIDLADGTQRDGNTFQVETLEEAVRLVKRGEAKVPGFSCYTLPEEWNLEEGEEEDG